MRVLHVIPSINPNLGGPTQVVLNLVKTLRHHKIDAQIATTQSNHLPEYSDIPIHFFSPFKSPLKTPHLTQDQVFLFSPEFTQWLWQNIHQYDILDNHYLFCYLPSCASFIARRHRIPYTIRTQGQLEPWALEQSTLKKQLYSLLIERKNLDHAAAIHCTSLGEAQDVRNFGIQTPTITLPLGVDLPIINPEAKQKLRQLYNIDLTTPIIVFLSRLHYKKRPDLLLQAVSQLRDKNYQFHLILAGTAEPDYQIYLENLITSLDLTSHVTLPGFVAGHSKNLLLQGSDLFVLPSYSENFGIAVAEAMAASLPVIITPGVQIAPDISAAEAGLVVQGEIEPLTEAIQKILQNPQLGQTLGKNGRKLVTEKYSWDIITQKLITAYSAIIHKQKIPQF